MHTTKQMEDLQISYTSALCAAVDISYDTQRHDDDSTDAIIKRQFSYPMVVVFSRSCESN